jgi:hypothetical protein
MGLVHIYALFKIVQVPEAVKFNLSLAWWPTDWLHYQFPTLRQYCYLQAIAHRWDSKKLPLKSHILVGWACMSDCITTRYRMEFIVSLRPCWSLLLVDAVVTLLSMSP